MPEERRRRRSATSWAEAHPTPAVLLAYLGLSLVLGWELLAPGRSLYRWDTLLYNWPLVLETRSQWLSGHIPFWAASFCCGTPLLENINAGVLYPLRLVCWLLPLKAGYHLFLLLHLWLSLVGMHVFLRRGLRLGLLPAFAGALAFAASGYARATWDTHNFMALPWIPLGLAAMLAARRAGGLPRAVLGCAACWSMMILGGDFQAAVLWLPAALLLALMRRDRARLTVALGLSALLAALVTAPQWLPSFFASVESYRAGGLAFSEAVERSFHPVRLLELCVPHAFGTHGTWFGAALAGEQAKKVLPWTASFHAGVLMLLPAALALRRRRLAAVRWSLILFVLSVFLSFGRFLPGFAAWVALPILRGFRYPEKYLLWATFALAVLAAHGVAALHALWTRRALAPMRRAAMWSWAAAVLAACAAACAAAVSVGSGGAVAWVSNRILWAILTVAVVYVARPKPCHAGIVLGLLFLLDAGVPWHTERPTTSRMDPLDPSAIARLVRNSPDPWGRVLRDPAARDVPLPETRDVLSEPEKEVSFYREALAVNSPRLWGLYSADGFSPMEAGAMRALRLRQLEPDKSREPDIASVIRFCRLAGVRWLLTTSPRADELAQREQAVEVVRRWRRPGRSAALVHFDDVPDAECIAPADTEGRAAKVQRVWRARAGRIRVDLQPGGPCDLLVRESHAPGWTARDARGRPLPVQVMSEAFVGVRLPAGVSQVRLSYAPVGWRRGLFLGALGAAASLLLAGLVLGRARLMAAASSRWCAAAASALLFAALGLAARGHWACTFDEGFHLARGMAQLETGDSRLSYFHPPLQNLAGAYFAGLAHSERTYMPVSSPGWLKADVGRFATDFAHVNHTIFPDMVQAARWGTALFGAALCALLALWAAQAAGPAAGWLAGLGAALNPNLLAHGNLATTDMAVTALALLGTFALVVFATSRRPLHLLLATCAFAAAALAKHTGLIWLAAFLFAALPLAAGRNRATRLFPWFVFGLLVYALLLIGLYGTGPQTIRAGPGCWLTGRSLPAGRYIEGLVSQGAHALEGHRAFFAGREFIAGSGWHMAMALVLKTPSVWLVAGVLGLVSIAVRKRPLAAWAAWLPAGLFACLLFGANRVAIGVRHALPIEALAVLAGAVWACRLRQRAARLAACAILAAGSLAAAIASYPNYIAYFPVWAGGVSGGHVWMVDSNYDWGQDLERVEASWARLTEENGGAPPRLIYFGFVDPRFIYDMPSASPSLRGFMDHSRRAAGDQKAYESWRQALVQPGRPVVASISALELNPYGLDMSMIMQQSKVEEIGNTFLLLRAESGGGSD